MIDLILARINGSVNLCIETRKAVMLEDILQDPLHDDFVHQKVPCEGSLHELESRSGGCSFQKPVFDLLWQRVVLVCARCVDMGPAICLCHMQDLGEFSRD